MDDALNEGVAALKSISESRNKLADVVLKLESATDEQSTLRDSINTLKDLLQQNEQALTKLEQSHSKMTDALQSEWRDTRESIRDRIDNTFAQLQQQISLSETKIESKLESVMNTILAHSNNQTENLVEEMPRSIFGKRGPRKR